MGNKPKILAFAGSTRTESFNKKLVKVAVKAAQAAGADVTLIDLKDYPMPLYDGDLEAGQGLPENAKKLKQIFLAHDGLMISAPEYNSSISGVLKNTIDWVSRAVPQEPPQDCFAGKMAVLMSASPGALGGLRGLVHVRAILSNMDVIVLPQQVAVSKAHEAFAADGTLKDSKQNAAIEKLGTTLADMIKKIKPA